MCLEKSVVLTTKARPKVKWVQTWIPEAKFDRLFFDWFQWLMERYTVYMSLTWRNTFNFFFFFWKGELHKGVYFKGESSSFLMMGMGFSKF